MSLPAVLKQQIINETQTHFGFPSLSEFVEHSKEENVVGYQAQLKAEKVALLDRLKKKFPSATDEEINRQLKEKDGEYYTYWTQLPDLVKEEKEKGRLQSWFVDVSDLSWIVKQRPYVRGGLVLSGAMALYYARHQRILGLVSGIAAAVFYGVVRDLNVIEHALKNLSAIDASTPLQGLREKGEKVFQEMKASGLFLSRYIKAQEQEKGLIDPLLQKFSEISKAIRGTLVVKGDFNPQQVQAFFEDLGKLTGKIKWGVYTSMVGGGVLALYAYRQKAYLMGVAGVIHAALAFKIGRTLGEYQGVSYAIAMAETATIPQVYQEQAQKIPYLSAADSPQKIHAEVIRLDHLLQFIPSWTVHTA
ncbi:MAG: hypothetical protein H7A38_03740 [Chlamydiales bacterium]|nr:hypothetical protein [Chlamydiales bacterium]